MHRTTIVAAALAVAAGVFAPRAHARADDLEKFQREVLAKLSGAAEIRPGVTLANRGTLENRQEARTYLLATLKKIGLEGERFPYGTNGGEDIVAELKADKATAGTETILLGAHYDSVTRGPGANDDGTGVVAVLAAARDLAKVKHRTRNVIIALFDEEERGLLGSKALAKKLKDDGRNLVAVHTVDQVGWDENHNKAVEIELPYDGAAALYEQAAKALKLDIPTYVTEESGSDHSAFRAQGFPAVGVTEEYRHKDTTPYIHKATDTFETVNFAYLGTCTRLVAEVIKTLATGKTR